MSNSKLLSLAQGVVFVALATVATGLSSTSFGVDDGMCANRSDSQSLADCLGQTYNDRLNEITHSQETLNKAKFYHLGMNSFPIRLDMVKNAKNFLYVSTLEWPSHDHRVAYLEKVIGERLEQGPLELHILHDPFFSYNHEPAGHSNIWVKTFAKDAEVVPWTMKRDLRNYTYDLLDYHLHDKQFIVDGRQMFLGGINVGYQYYEGGQTPYGWHDEDLYLEGPAVQQATHNWIHAFEISKYINCIQTPEFKEATNGCSLPPSETEDAVIAKQGAHGAIKVLRDYFYDLEGDRQDLHEDFYYLVPKGAGGPQGQPFNELLNKIAGHLEIKKYLNAEHVFDIPVTADMTVPVRIIYDNQMIDRDPTTGQHFSKVVNTLEFLLKNAKKEVVIYMPYLSLSQNVVNILADAAKHVSVTVITNSYKSIDKPTKDPKSASYDRGYITQALEYETIINSGVKLYEWQGHADLLQLEKDNNCKFPGEVTQEMAKDWRWPGDTLHTKMVIADRSVMMVGSDNMDVRSEMYNNEVMGLVRDEGIAKQAYQEVYQTDMAMGRQNQKIKCYTSTFKGAEKFVMVPQPREVELVTIDGTRKFLAAHPRKGLDKIIFKIFPGLPNKIN